MEIDTLRHTSRWYLGWLVAPLLLLQGVWIRSRALRLPDAAGPASGVETSVASTHDCIRLAVIGESPVAGVGVESLQEGMACQAARALSQRLACSVEWQSHGVTGSRASQWGDWLAEKAVAEVDGADIVVVVLGVNDSTGLSSRRVWRNSLVSIIESLSQGSARTLIFTSVPPLRKFTALAPPLCVWLGARSSMLDVDLVNVVTAAQQRLPDCHITHLSASPDLAPEMLAEDGFHPSAKGYREWARLLAQHIEMIKLSS